VGDVVHLGIDENGLGPRLGPLIVTAVTARVGPRAGEAADPAKHAKAPARPRGAMSKRLGDSKKLVSHGDTGLGEAWARAIARRMGAAGTKDPDSLVHAFSLDSQVDLRAPCPGDHRAQCWDETGEAFVADEGLVTQVDRDLTRLADKGIDVVRVACVIACARRLNEGVDRGHSRFHVDLHAMERLIIEARDREGSDVVATCGKVGGFDKYPPAFGPMNGRLHAVAVEGRARSEYSIPGVGRVAFVRDADDKHLLVSMASLVGKWVRDLLMARVVRYHRASQPDLPDASGYHDPVTTRFIDATRLTRKERALPDACFERRALDAAT
jgi:ribonuclease HII